MADGGTRPESPLGVALALADGALLRRLAEAIGADGRLFAASAGEAEIVIADPAHLATASGPTILLGGTDGDAAWPTVRAVLPEDASLRVVLAAVEIVAAGLVVLPDHAVDGAAEDNGGLHEEAAGIVLTPRERQVLQLLADGASNKVIARRLGVSVHTAKFHVASLTRKLGASGRLEAVGIGLRLGLAMV